MQQKLIKVEKTCDYCEMVYTFDVDSIGFELWRSGAAHIQDALPSLSAGYRELLISGCCDECFNDTFPDEDDEMDYDDFDVWETEYYNDQDEWF